jgi:hypothetical protein
VLRVQPVAQRCVPAIKWRSGLRGAPWNSGFCGPGAGGGGAWG